MSRSKIDAKLRAWQHLRARIDIGARFRVFKPKSSSRQYFACKNFSKLALLCAHHRGLEYSLSFHGPVVPGEGHEIVFLLASEDINLSNGAKSPAAAAAYARQWRQKIMRMHITEMAGARRNRAMRHARGGRIVTFEA